MGTAGGVLLAAFHERRRPDDRIDRGAERGWWVQSRLSSCTFSLGPRLHAGSHHRSCRLGFTHPWVSRVWAACDVENHSSARALEKARFSREGVLPQFSVHLNISSDPRDCYAYALTRGV